MCTLTEKTTTEMDNEMNHLELLTINAHKKVNERLEPLELCEGVELMANGFADDIHDCEQLIITSSDNRFYNYNEED